jgi:hypothetical protein
MYPPQKCFVNIAGAISYTNSFGTNPGASDPEKAAEFNSINEHIPLILHLPVNDNIDAVSLQQVNSYKKGRQILAVFTTAVSFLLFS